MAVMKSLRYNLDVDPFRDELAAAHAKIAQLEAEVHRLNADRYPAQTPSPVNFEELSLERNRVTLIMLIGGMTVILIAVLIGVIFLTRATPIPTTTSAPAVFSGVAIAPTAQAPQVTPSASPPLDKQPPHVSSKPCNCTPGDPLCSCL